MKLFLDFMLLLPDIKKYTFRGVSKWAYLFELKVIAGIEVEARTTKPRTDFIPNLITGNRVMTEVCKRKTHFIL